MMFAFGYLGCSYHLVCFMIVIVNNVPYVKGASTFHIKYKNIFDNLFLYYMVVVHLVTGKQLNDF